MTASSIQQAIVTCISAGAFAVCGAGIASAQTTAASPTFAKDVVPIFQAKCQVCHQPNSIAPMSLLTYDDAKKYASRIRARVVARVMPPWHKIGRASCRERV